MQCEHNPVNFGMEILILNLKRKILNLPTESCAGEAGLFQTFFKNISKQGENSNKNTHWVVRFFSN